jgi:two-component system cell cycle sensor histidine kinase/response regulator CckA
MNPPPAKPSRRILVVDDNQSIHDDFRKILAGPRPTDEAGVLEAKLFDEQDHQRGIADFEVDFAFQGQEACELVRQARLEGRPYVAAFIDVRMPPGWDGIETTARLWEIEPDLQVVICTAYSDYSWSEMTDKLGNSDRLLILKKPFDNIEALQLATTLTEKWRLTQEARARVDDLEAMVRTRTSELTATLSRLEKSLADHERTEAALQASEEKFSKAFRMHPDAVSIQRLRDGHYLDINPSFTAITGYTAADVAAQDAAIRQPALWVNAEEHARFVAALNRDGEITGLEAPLRHKEGTVLRGLISARIVEIDGETCVLAITRDLTVQRNLEEQLAQAQKMEAVGQLAGGVAHDFNNILTASLLQLELLLEQTQLAPETRLALKELEKMSNRAASLTRQLLAFSRRQVIQIRVVDLNEVLGNLLVMLKRLLGENVQVDFQHATTPLWLKADVGMLEQVVTNLCVNARDAMMPLGGRLLIEADAVVLGADAIRVNPEAGVGRFVRLTVADTGCGMDAATLPRIFEPFFTTKEVGKGTGLGLPTVYGITKQHGGWVEVRSAPGHGATFRVYFPAVTTAALVGSGAPFPKKKSGGETILVVEDEEPVRFMVSLTLKKCGYVVLEAPDGRAALDTWGNRAGEIDLLFTDMVMPNGITGLDLAEHFKRANPNLKVILTSGYSVKLSKSGAPVGTDVVFLAKPYKVGVLTSLVRKCLDDEPAGPATDLGVGLTKVSAVG